MDWRALLTQDARAIYESSRKSLEIPALLADILRTGLKGEANLGVEHHAGEDVRKLVIAMVRKLCLMLLSLGLLIFGGAVAGNGPQVFGAVCRRICAVEQEKMTEIPFVLLTRQ